MIEAAGLSEVREHTQAAPTPHVLAAEAIATPTDRVRQLRRELCAVVDCEDAVQYLASRGLWPLPAGCTLSAHVLLKYFEDGRCLGRYPAIVADVVDVAGEFVTAHVTYLEGGKKLAKLDADGTLLSPRKKLSGLRGRTGCAARLMPAGEVLAIAEGIETALSAALLDELSAWAALDACSLEKFEPPPSVGRLLIYPDRDEAGLTAACRLMERLQGRVSLEVRIPKSPAKDWNDTLQA